MFLNTSRLARHLALALPLVLPTLAHAHAGHLHEHTGFLAGFSHPFTGLDHLAAMLAVGAWSALAVRPAPLVGIWAAPLAFVAALLAGALAAQFGLQLPGVEPMIAASLLVLGLLVATRAKLPPAVALLLCGGFAFFHGAAHGSELAGDGAWAALLGMVLATALLHAGGIGLGRWVLGQRRLLTQVGGGAVAVLGSALLLRMAF